MVTESIKVNEISDELVVDMSKYENVMQSE
jgi:hypothetical protein